MSCTELTIKTHFYFKLRYVFFRTKCSFGAEITIKHVNMCQDKHRCNVNMRQDKHRCNVWISNMSETLPASPVCVKVIHTMIFQDKEAKYCKS